MTLTAGPQTCGGPDQHEWVLRTVDFEDGAAVRTFECLTCGCVDHRDLSTR